MIRRGTPLVAALVAIAACQKPRESMVVPCNCDCAIATPDAPRQKLVDDMVFVPAGRMVARQLRCVGGLQRQPTSNVEHARQEQDAFKIDRVTVSCEDYESCVASGACVPRDPRREGCIRKAATVAFYKAEAYCAWRGAALPTYAQWQRSIRGKNADTYVSGATWIEGLVCLRPTNDRPLRGCLQRSNDGVQYVTENINRSEWTRDVDCSELEGRLVHGVVAVDLMSQNLDGISILETEAEFRCALGQ